MKNKNIIILACMLGIYFALKYYIPYGNYLIYPINILVTFLHEFGHAFFALLTGGTVSGVDINSDGSGLATTSGGIKAFIIMGGYIGSAIFGNILLYISIKKPKISKQIIYFIGGLMLFVGLIWFADILSSLILFIFGGVLIYFAKNGKFHDIFLQFIGVSSLLFIIEDFNVGPKGDLAHFSDLFIIIPSFIWMVIWLAIVLLITGLNLKLIFKK